MANVIGIMGESGSGKTTSLRNLDPSTTFYLDADKKGLNWKGWREQYNVDKKNYYRTDSPAIVTGILEKINKEKQFAHIKTVVIDTINGIMVAEEMRNLKITGYGKWTDLASYIFNIVDFSLTMRDDITVIVVAHSETVSDDNGQVFTRIRTNGRKLDKIVLESKLTTVLYAERKDGKYIFHTSMDRTTAKAPIGAFDAEEIPNDMSAVLKALEGY